jgi:nucleoside-diphosphate-sugar epimerase
MRVLLTGSSGWLGRFLAPRLRAAGHQVAGLDVAPGADTQVVASVSDRAAIDRVFGEILPRRADALPATQVAIADEYRARL